VDLDWVLLHTRLTEEGVDLNLVEFIDLMIADSGVGMVNQPLYARRQCHEERLRG
jgi:hypothetical protein